MDLLCNPDESSPISERGSPGFLSFNEKKFETLPTTDEEEEELSLDRSYPSETEEANVDGTRQMQTSLGRTSMINPNRGRSNKTLVRVIPMNNLD